MKIFAKAKTRAASAAAKNDSSELMTAVTKIAERLEALERKMDRVISQTSSRSFVGREESPKQALPPVVPPQPFRQPVASARPNEAKPVQGQPRVHTHERRERILHKAVCADCHKDCEIPFKPTGERPVYCKECFSKRKAGNSFKGNSENKQAPGLPTVPAEAAPPQRKVMVTKKGVGKVTISEIVRPSSRESSPRGKGPRPEKKSKR